MEFNLSDEHKLLQRSVREFARKEVAPHAQEIERKGEFPIDLFHAVTELGWLGASIPVEYGGGGLDLLADFIIAEELATALPGFAMDCMVHSGVIGYKVIDLVDGRALKAVAGERLEGGIEEQLAGLLAAAAALCRCLGGSHESCRIIHATVEDCECQRLTGQSSRCPSTRARLSRRAVSARPCASTA